MTWVKLEDSVRLDMRAKIALITRQDFVNLTERPISEFIDILRRNQEISKTEEIVREILVKMHPDAKHWTITQIGFSLRRQGIEVVVEHPSFGRVRPTHELPLVPDSVCAGDEIYPNTRVIESPAVANGEKLYWGPDGAAVCQ